MISLIVPLRLDGIDRFKNLELFLKYYHKLDEIVIIEDGVENNNVKQLCDSYNNVVYIFNSNKSFFQKGLLYNKAAKVSKGDFIIAIDVDVIIKAEQIMKSVQKLNEKTEKAIILPYNGTSLYTTDLFKEEFTNNTDDSFLEKRFPQKLIMQYRNQYLRIPNIHSSGGCVIFKRKDYFDGGGFNPNFKGWGYEDDEVLYRYQKLGYTITRLNGPKDVLWHLNHNGTIREQNPNLMNNRQIILNEKEMDNDTFMKYIGGWKND